MTTLVIGDTVLGHFFVAEDARRALNGLQRRCRDLTVQPLAEAVGGRSWCLTGHVCDTSERLVVTTVIERWNGQIAPEKELVP